MKSVVDIARSWIGTPYVHQASSKGCGADCLGLIRGIWREKLGEEPVDVPPYTEDWSEPQQKEVLWQTAKAYLIPLEGGLAILPGEVLLFRMRTGSVAKHLGLVSEVGTISSFIHSYSGQGVIESPFSIPWQKRVVARFRFPSTDNARA